MEYDWLGFGYAALVATSGRWAAVSGVALVVAVLSHPSSLPAAGTLGLTLLVLGHRHRPVVVGLLGGGGLASVVVVLGIVLGPGLAALLDTVAYTAEYQAGRPSPGARWGRAFRRYLDGLVAWRHLPAFALAALALLPGLSWPRRGLAALAIPVAVAAAAWTVVPPTIVDREPFGLLSGAFALLVTTLLLAPVLVWAVRTGERDIRLLLALTLPLALVGVTSFSMVSSAGVTWGVAAPPVQPLLGVLGAGVVLWVSRPGRPALAAVGVLVLVGALVVVHPLRTFQNPDPRQLVGRVAQGPLAGLRTDANYLEADCALRAVVGAWVGPGDGVFFYARSGGYAYSEAPIDTNLVWLSDFGAANRWTVDWWEQTGRWPDVAVVYPAAVRAAGGWDELAAQDPIIASLDTRYGPRVETEGYLVLRRDGTVREPLADPPAGCPAAR